MNFEAMREWLARKLAHADDTVAAAGGSSLDELRRDTQVRTVTPTVLETVPTQVGQVVRYVREQRGWSQQDLADLADIDEVEIVRIESDYDVILSPRSVVNLARVCSFSTTRFQQLANHVTVHSAASNQPALRFAARSANIGSLTAGEFDAVRALVDVLSEDTSDAT